MSIEALESSEILPQPVKPQWGLYGWDVYGHAVAHWQQGETFRQLPTPKLGINFASNDYLVLSQHPAVIQAAVEATQWFGVGSTGARLLSGNSAAVEHLEQTIARCKGTEAALVFNSGYQANSSVLATLLDKTLLGTPPLVFFDKLNHASLYPAIAQSRAELHRYPHPIDTAAGGKTSLDYLETLLEKHSNNSRPKVIVAETVYGMDGDITDVPRLVALARANNSALYLDEAHATGVLGPNGYGVTQGVDFQGVPTVILTTFSKGLGCFGASVACSQAIKDLLINRCGGFIYTTALPPSVIASVQATWELLPSLATERAHIQRLAQHLREGLHALGFSTGVSNSHIVPVIVGNSSRACHLRDIFMEQGVVVSVIRPPTVPHGTARLRFALNAQHTLPDIEAVLRTLQKETPC
ncbi:MAG: 8-amino-7-oxononanoate synthase [Vampirovibrionales bacterium]|nr:8-amino-7-oxononanoate synthase [Vampirovibrionales bacterium]